MVCAAADGMLEFKAGEVGIPDGVVPEADLNFADEAGTGRKAWPGLEFAGSKGEAFKMFLGIEVTGCALMTSLFLDKRG